MKRIIILAFLLISVTKLSAQFFQGWGIMGGITYHHEKWWVHNLDGSTDKFKQKSILRFNGLVFAEFVKNAIESSQTLLLRNLEYKFNPFD